MSVLDDIYLLVSKVHLGLMSLYYVDKISLYLFCICQTAGSFCSGCSVCADEVSPFSNGVLLIISFSTFFSEDLIRMQKFTHYANLLN